MVLTEGQRRICERMINVFETGSIKGRYGAISIYNDGPGRVRQITYGRSQTTEYGNLKQLLQMYVEANGAFAGLLAPYIPRIKVSPLADDEGFKSLLRKAGEGDPIMRDAQDRFFEKVYFQPAMKWADDNGFVLPLSMLVIYDSFIHSGKIRPELRKLFPATPPAAGGDEKGWTQQYVEVRHEWLSTHSNPEVRPSAYRTRDLLREIRRQNWGLSQQPISANGTPVDDHFEPTGVFPGGLMKSEGAVASTESDRIRTLHRLAVGVGVSKAVDRLVAYRDAHRPASDPRYWAVVNFDLHSNEPRLFLFDCVAGNVTAHLCAHGRGSEGTKDDGYAEVFSNVDGSNCSSLGIYHCDVTYFGGHGKSLYLDGLESTNSAARRRHIVMHGADYVSPEWIAAHKRLGRSLGCPAISMDQIETIIPALMGGSLMILWKSADA